MTSSLATKRPRGLFAATNRSNFVRFPVAVGMAELGALFAISALVDLTDGADITLEFLLASVVAGGIGVAELRRVPRPSVTSAPAVMTMTTLAFVTVALGGAAAHLIADATDEVDTAILEGTAPITTTAMSGLDPDLLPRGLLMFRALGQWVGGLGGLIVALVVIPLLFGGNELGGRGQSSRGERALIRGRTRGLRNVLILYGVLTVLLVVAFAAAGLGVFDAVAHSMATVSTGGLSTRAGSVGAFGDAAVEWVAIAGMAVAGLNLGVVWWAVQRDHKALRRHSELKTYLVIMVLATAAIAGWLGSDYAAVGSIRTAAFAVTSAMSTTGFTTASWWDFDNGAQVVLLVLLSIGAMAGSAGGGFRHLRVLQAFRFAGRELRRQLHPSAVSVVRINGRAVHERSLDRMVGYIIVFVAVAASGGMLIELGDSSVTPSAAISLSLSALSTTGAQVIDPVDLGSIGTITKLTLSALMLLGRLSIYTVLLTIINVVVRSSDHIERRWYEARS